MKGMGNRGGIGVILLHLRFFFFYGVKKDYYRLKRINRGGLVSNFKLGL